MMRLPKFAFLQARSVKEAVEMIADAGPTAMFVAGGTDLYPNMKRRHQMPKTVIGLSRVRELRRKHGRPEDGLVLGAGMTLTDVCEDRAVRSAYPALADAVSQISTPLLRNMGTIGGNLMLDTRCTYYNQNYEWRKAIHFCLKKDGDTCWVAPSSPRCWAVQSSDSAPVMVAVGAKFRFVSKAGGERLVEARDAYNDDGIQYLRKRPDELLAEIHLPAVNGWRASFAKLRRRGAFDFPVLNVGAWARMKGPVVEEARIVLGAVGSHPIEAVAAAKGLAGKPLTDESIRAAAEAAFAPAKPLDNTDFVMGWRKEMVRVYVTRALREIRDGRPPGRFNV
jgi:4-hydroxybenzoyl-CoA reductase subunit beta